MDDVGADGDSLRALWATDSKLISEPHVWGLRNPLQSEEEEDGRRRVHSLSLFLSSYSASPQDGDPKLDVLLS